MGQTNDHIDQQPATSPSSQSVRCKGRYRRFYLNQFKTAFYPPAIMECIICHSAQQ